MNPLQEYTKKRDFKKTKEPSARIPKKAKSKNPIFVVQEHHASHLHYDFRLEHEGVLKSWAVPKGPSMVPGEKRLAVEVEDHPLDYASFSGSIPEGEYGAGEVYIWDEGVWEPSDDPSEALEKGHLEFQLKGKKLKGAFMLIRTRNKSGKKNQWLLLKRHDKDAVSAKSSSKSTKTARTTSTRKTAGKKTSSKDFIAPQLALLVDQPPEGKNWIHETKFDGYRIHARFGSKGPSLLTRSGQDWTSKYAPIVSALKKLKLKDSLLDGEVVALDQSGKSDFQLLQNAMQDKDFQNIVYCVFDVLILEGKDLRELPLTERKKHLEKVLKGLKDPHVQFVESLEGSGKKLLKNACAEDLEGIISKQTDSTYTSGRADTWVKSKCKKRQEFVIGGYTDPQGSRKGFGALLLGVYEDKKLRYVGKVGTGFNQEIIADLMKRFQKISQDKSPFSVHEPREKGTHWLKPQMVAEINFANWTNDEILRVPVYQGLREDKPATQIRREEPKPVKEAGQGKTLEEKAPELTHPDKVLYKKEGITKADLAKYYDKISKWILPHLEKRPLSLLRCPSGSTEGCFFQKHSKPGDPKVLQGVKIREKTKSATYFSADTPADLTALVQIGSLELHPWNSRFESLESPDQIVMDFDPSPDISWKQVVKSSFELKKILDALKLPSFVKVTGGKGVHVHIPLKLGSSWEEVLDFSRELASVMMKQNPDLYLIESGKGARDQKIFIDYMRNSRGTTAVAPYSLRAKEVSAVALPLTWEELKKVPASNAFTLEKAMKKVSQRKEDPWKNYFKSASKLPSLKALAKL